ncbi:PIN domain-containing protein, partial [bacterium]|nr:PIN domain-containing protein [bacterium]
MMVVDSSVWVALFSENDSQHGKAVKVSALLSNVVLTEYVILETSSFLLRAVGKAEAKKFLEFALNNSEVAVLYSSPEFFADVSHLFRSLEHVQKLLTTANSCCGLQTAARKDSKYQQYSSL